MLDGERFVQKAIVSAVAVGLFLIFLLIFGVAK
jgi:hypothetical protein